MTRTSRWFDMKSVIGGLAVLLMTSSLMAEEATSEMKITLLSDEAADACIQDVGCLLDLFLEATLGEASGRDTQRIVKWNSPALAASVTGVRLPAELRPTINQALFRMTLIANSAGVDVKLAEDVGDGVVNLVFMISDDLKKDRDDTFANFLSTVFAGEYEFYDDLAAGPSPVCQSQLFVDGDHAINGGLALAETKAEAAGLGQCVQRITLRGLGLRYPLPSGVDSVLNEESERQEWTSVDYVLLKILYDPMIERGMGAEEIASVFPKLHRAFFGPSS